MKCATARKQHDFADKNIINEKRNVILIYSYTKLNIPDEKQNETETTYLLSVYSYKIWLIILDSVL